LPTLTKDGKPAQGVNRPGSPPQPQPGAWSTRTETVASGDDLKADNSRITLKTVNLQGREDSLTIEIVRPAIPASLVAAVTRRESVDKPSQVGDAVVTEIAGGQTMVSSVTPVGESAGGDRRRGNTGVNSPYHLVLEKGQRLPAKPGRSDDMPWPRQETLPNASADTGAPGALPEVRRPPAAKGGPTKAGQPRG
jgi:hypothetical protein